MQPEYILKILIEHGDKMRQLQKAYYATPGYFMERKKAALGAAKQAEAKFDKLLAEAKKVSNG